MRPQPAKVAIVDFELGLGSGAASAQWRELAKASKHGVVEDPAEADLILFTELSQVPVDFRSRRIRDHPAYREFPRKCFVYDERDRPWLLLPGLYVSVDRGHWVPRLQRSWLYFHGTDLGVSAGAPNLLASFVGSATHKCRDPLFRLNHPRFHVERVEGFLFWRDTNDAERRSVFAESIASSSFVLCPRGHGTSSIRLMETMSAGRVPVIMSDGWVPPAGPDWPSFSVRWPEGRSDGLLEHLERLEPAAEQMGRDARAAYERWFRSDVYFDRSIDQLLSIERRPSDRMRGALDPALYRNVGAHIRHLGR